MLLPKHQNILFNPYLINKGFFPLLVSFDLSISSSRFFPAMFSFKSIFCKIYQQKQEMTLIGSSQSFLHVARSKVPFWQNGKIAKMALLNPCMKFKKIFCQKTSFEALQKCHLQKIFITFSRVCQIQDLGQSKYKLRLFSKRTHGISKILFNLCSREFLARLESKIRKCLFFDGSLL